MFSMNGPNGLFRPDIYYAIAIANAITIVVFFYGGGIGIACTITQMGTQPILEPNGNHNRNHIINLRCK